MEFRDEDLKEIIMKSLLRIKGSNTEIFSVLDKIKEEKNMATIYKLPQKVIASPLGRSNPAFKKYSY